MITNFRIRKNFEPLTVVSTLRVETQTSSPLTQVYDGSFVPDRGILPLIIFPDTTAGCTDGSWQNGTCNSRLASMKWMVNGSDITTLSEWNGKYLIDTTDDNTKRGALTIMRNVSPLEKIELRFEAVIADNRTGMNVPVKSNSLTLSTVDEAADMYSLSIGEDTVIRYNPFEDKLLEYEYKVACNIVPYSDSGRNAVLDKSSYERHIPVTVLKGTTPITSGYTLKLYSIDGTTLTEIDTTSEEIMSLSLTDIVLDLRLIEKGDYKLSLLVDGAEKNNLQFSVGRIYPAFRVVPASTADITPGDVALRNKAIILVSGNIVEYPDQILDIIWQTETAVKTETFNNGSITVIPLSDTGIGDNYDDAKIDIHIDASQIHSQSVLTDGDNDLTDENDNTLIG